MTTFQIPKCYIDNLERKLAKVQSKCSKYGCEFSYSRCGEEDVLCNESIVPCVTIDVSGRAIVNGWEFIATITHVQGASNLIQGLRMNCEFSDIPEFYRTAKCCCDHCGTNRRRVKTVLIRNIETGEFKQVGTNCVKDYTCGMSSELIAALSSIDAILCQDDISRCDSDDYFADHLDAMEPAYSVKNVIALAIDTIQIDGRYIPASAEGEIPTVHSVKECIRRDIAPSSEALDMALEMIDWVKTQPDENSFIYNAKAICDLGFVRFQNVGAVACIPALKIREDKKNAENKAGNFISSDFVGEIKGKVTIEISDVISECRFENRFGCGHVVKFADEKNNLFVWFASGSTSCIKAGCRITATVKDHSIYRGCRQTVVIRCKAINENNLALCENNEAESAISDFLKSCGD